MRSFVKVSILLFLIIIIVQQSNALDRVPPDTTEYVEEFIEEEETTAYQPYLSLGLGFSNRLDDRKSIESYPSINFRLIDYFHPYSAAKFGFSYSRQKYKTILDYPTAEVNILMLETGIQWMVPANTVRPFLGLTFEYNYYNVSNYDLSENRIGMNIVVGSEVRLTRTMRINLEVSQTINNVDYGYVDYNPPYPGYYENFIYGIYNDKLSDEIFNHAAFKVFLLYNL